MSKLAACPLLARTLKALNKFCLTLEECQCLRSAALKRTHWYSSSSSKIAWCLIVLSMHFRNYRLCSAISQLLLSCFQGLGLSDFLPSPARLDIRYTTNIQRFSNKKKGPTKTRKTSFKASKKTRQIHAEAHQKRYL